MPELPEVETTRRGIERIAAGERIRELRLYEPRLRWRVEPQIAAQIATQRVRSVERRAKYLLLRLERGTVILHLGMSGSLRSVPVQSARGKHDHVDIVLESDRCLRLTDPRRFG